MLPVPKQGVAVPKSAFKLVYPPATEVHLLGHERLRVATSATVQQTPLVYLQTSNLDVWSLLGVSLPSPIEGSWDAVSGGRSTLVLSAPSALDE